MAEVDAQALRGHWLVPRFAVPLPVLACMTTRSGGASRGAHAASDGGPGLNLGRGCGDDADAVAANRRATAAAIGAPILWLRQVHGTVVVDGDAAVSHEGTEEPEADAAFTTRFDLALAVMAADCLPIIVADRRGRIVGVAHGGWRGLAAGVVDALVDAMRSRLPDADLLAWLGPRIGPSRFEVGPEVREAFVRRAPSQADAFVARTGSDRWLGDLGAIARADLAARGVAAIVDSALCTVSDARRFWSHRRDRPGGRMAAIVRRLGPSELV